MAAIFRQLVDRETCTYTYILGDSESGEAVLIDPVLEQVERDVTLLSELGLKLKFTVETHVHADHITGASRLKELTGAEIVYPARSKVEVADHLIANGGSLQFGSQRLTGRVTPGHTEGCMTWIWKGQNKVFTGDTLMIRGCGRTDFQGGSSTDLFCSVREVIFSMDAETELYPGHDYEGQTMTTVAEERAHNPRLGMERSEVEFVEIMENLELSYPMRIDVALPANMKAGKL
jgi:sulfur dioxygenase